MNSKENVMSKKSKKKKKQQRRHHFVQNQETAQANSPNSKQATITAQQKLVKQSKQTKEVERPAQAGENYHFTEKLTYMKHDARITAFIGGGIVAGLLVLWLVFEHTGLGASIYNWIRI